MIKTKKVKVTETKTQIVDVICNMCGETCNNLKRNNKKDKQHVEYSGLIETEVHGGYASEVVGDLTSWKFSICEHCLKTEVISKFKIPYLIKDNDVSSEYVTIEQNEKLHLKASDANKKYAVEQLLKRKTHKRKDLQKMTMQELHELFHKK